MGKKRQIDLLTINIEDKLDKNGALRNVAVKDAWQRLRQKIEVQSWEDAVAVLSELSDNLQKINMVKSVAGLCAKLRKVFQNPDDVADDGDSTTTGDTPRDTHEDLPKDSPKHPASDAQLQTLTRDLSYIKKRLENSEAERKELEKKLETSNKEVEKLTATVHKLEKKNNSLKEEKMGEMKELMKLKSLERQVEVKTVELVKTKEEKEVIKKQLDEFLNEKSSDIADLYNTHPPDRISELFQELFVKNRADCFNYYKSTRHMPETQCAEKTLSILSDAHSFCLDIAKNQIQSLTSDLLYPGETLTETKILNSFRLEESDLRQIHNLRKQTCKHSVESVKNAFVTTLEDEEPGRYSLEELTECMPYIEKCVELCWFMQAQTPPVYIDFDDLNKQDFEMDKTKYDSTSGKGKTVDCVLWPPLYRTKGDSLLSKGHVITK